MGGQLRACVATKSSKTICLTLPSAFFWIGLWSQGCWKVYSAHSREEQSKGMNVWFHDGRNERTPVPQKGQDRVLTLLFKSTHFPSKCLATCGCAVNIAKWIISSWLLQHSSNFLLVWKIEHAAISAKIYCTFSSQAHCLEKHLAYIFFSSCEVSYYLIMILNIRDLRPRELKWLAQGHTGIGDLNPHVPDSKGSFLNY